MAGDAGFVWDLDFDAAWFVPLPGVDGSQIGPDAAAAWTDAALARLPDAATSDPQRAALLRATAGALLSQAEEGVTRLWFAPGANVQRSPRYDHRVASIGAGERSE